MYRSLSRIRFPYIADIRIRDLSSHLENKQKNFSDCLESARTFTSTIGHKYIGYGGESYKKSMQFQIVNALRSGERAEASRLLSDLGNGNYSIKANDFVHILDYCGQSPDPLFVLETLKLVREKEISLNNRCYKFIIKALCLGGYLEEAFNLISIIGDSDGIYPVLPAYNDFLMGCSHARKQTTSYANYCLDLMERHLVGKNEITYRKLLKLAEWQKNLPAIHEIWLDYTKYYCLNIFTLHEFIKSFIELGDLTSAYETLQQMVSLALKESFSINKTSKDILFPPMMDIPIPSNKMMGFKMYHLDDADSTPIFNSFEQAGTVSINSQLLTSFGLGSKEAKGRGSNIWKKHRNRPLAKVLRWSYNNFIHACAKVQNRGLAEQLFAQMQNLGIEPSLVTYDGFVRAIVSDRGSNDVMEVFKVMQQRNLKPRDPTLATLSIECSKMLELDLAEAMLDEISEHSHVNPYNVFLVACDTLDQPERAVKILLKMKQFKIQFDVMTYEVLFSLFGNVNAPYEKGNVLSQVDAVKRIKAIEKDMEKNGILHSQSSMNNLLRALGAEGMVEELIHYLHVAENHFNRGNCYLATPIYNTVLHSLIEENETHMAADIFKAMRYFGFRPDDATYHIMLGCCSATKCFQSACVLLSLMLRDGYCLQSSTYTALMEIWLSYGEFDEATDLLDKASSEGIQPDLILFNTILREASRKGRIDVIELIAEQMLQKKIQPDSSTCTYIFSAYVDCGFQSTAIEALEVLSMLMISQEDVMLQEKRKFFEGFIFAEDSEAESQLFEFFKGYEESLTFALLSLRWCAMVGSSISWSPDQSPWTIRLSKNHRTGQRKAS
ncbi:Pentatricopeptide repeat [Dillenia turbinata]|uniref:Pentatricopeptide repeat n=1 Tax=Dillenia turbinata TaxID=194707 RepID=A0AAN8W0J5_9MAGN